MAGKPRREGYLLIDHTFSPGITPEQLYAAGLSGLAVGADEKGEFATVTCCHCNTIVILNPLRTRNRNYCYKCDQYVCDNPACNVGCLNFDKLLDFVQDMNARTEDRGLVVSGLPDLSKLYSTITVSTSLTNPPNKGE